VLAIIEAQPKVDDCDYVFPSQVKTTFSGFGKSKAALDKAVLAAMKKQAKIGAKIEPLPNWTLHDLRRTMVTVMNEKLAVQPHIVEAVVNHMSGLAKAGVAGVYNRALYLDDRRSALDGWSRYIMDLART